MNYKEFFDRIGAKNYYYFISKTILATTIGTFYQFNLFLLKFFAGIIYFDNFTINMVIQDI